MAFPTLSKLAFISTCVLSVAVIIKLSVPWLKYFTVSELPVIYSSLSLWLRPPYIYLVINCIIISILASSKLQTQKTSETFNQTGGEHDTVVDSISKSVQPQRSLPQRSDSLEILFEKLEKNEKPLVSARFGHKKSVKSSPEASKATVLGVSKSKRNDTLENTWKMITDGRAMPLARHLKKSDTWESHIRRDEANSASAEKMKKSETFSENRSKVNQISRQGSSGKLKKEPSLSQDELNRRVEAFIKKFNEEMRLQRQESLKNQFQEMINRGAY